MKKIFILALLAMMGVGTQAQRHYDTVEGDPMGVRIYTLDNGLKVYLSVNQEKPRIAAHIAVNTGHRNDPAETTGLAHYLEHLMFKGTKSFGTSNYEAEKPLLDQITQLYEEHYRLTDPEARKAKYHEIDSVSQVAAQYNIPNEYDKLMAAIGSEGSNAYTWYDITCYTEDIPANEVENWAKIQSDRFQNMVIRGFHTELEAVYEEKNISLSSDDEKQFDALMAKLFPSHSYGTQTTIGTQEHLKNPSIVNIQNYFNHYYKPNNVAICMVGDLDYDKTMDAIEKYFGAWQPGNDISPRQFPAQPIFTAPQDTSVVGIEQESVILGWRFKGAADLQNDTLQLVSDILSNGKAGLIDLDLNQKMLMLSGGAQRLALKDYSALALVGYPKEEQTLDQVKALLLGEVEKLKKGDFDESLITAIANNMKLRYNRQIEENRGRVGKLVDAYINGEPWANAVHQIDRIAQLKKEDVVRFANQYLTDGYVCALKLQGEDSSIKKIDKPEITPIPTNRDMHSAFLDDITKAEVAPIEPKFADFEKELTLSETKKKGLPFIYKQNTTNDIFTLQFRYEFGNEADNRYDVASDYITLLGTDKLTNEDIQKKFYALACNYSVHVGEESITVSITGLNENLAEALALTEDVLHHAKADTAVYRQHVEQLLKMRLDEKNKQRPCFNRAWYYAIYGTYNPYTNIMSTDALKNTDPKTLLDLLSDLANHEHTVIYYGPSSEKDVATLVCKLHKTPKKLQPALENKHYTLQQTPQNEVLLAPYEAKNIYMRKYHNEGLQWTPEKAPVEALFNEYFGGGMNTIVFQELREARGLAYNASAYYASPERKGEPEYAMEHIISQNDKMADCISVFNDITEQMPQSEAAFQLAKQSLTKTLQSRRVTKTALIAYYFQMKKLGLDHDLYETVYKNLPSLTLQDITRFEQEHMTQKPWHYIILGDEKELDMDALQQIAPVKRLTLEDIFGY